MVRFNSLLRAACWIAVSLSAGAAVAQEPATPQQAPLIVHLLDYIAVDYPQFVRDGVVLDEPEFAEQQEFALEVQTHLAALPATPARAELAAAAAVLAAAIAAHADGTEVAHQATALRDRVIAAFELAASPRRTPDLAQGAALYSTHCAGCHGLTGRADGAAAAALDPKPSNFHDDARMTQRSLYGLYNTISLGVGGTGMVAFTQLSDDERWALAFHAANLRQTPEALAIGKTAWGANFGRERFTDLHSLVATSATALPTPPERAALAWLTAHPEALKRGNTAVLAEGQRLLAESLAAYAAGDAARAQELAVASYLQGFEPIEAALDVSAPKLRVAVEARMQALRSALRRGAPREEVELLAASARDALSEVEATLAGNRMSAKTAAISAFVILFREGLEAILVVAAVLALLVRAGRADATRYVHAGWIAALALGGITWFVAHALIDISGAAREITEGVAALLAAAILLYVGYWMHSKANAQAWQKFIATHLKGALSNGTLWALTGVSFLAVYREAFETVLFYEALWAQGGPQVGAALLGGLSAAVALLLAICVMVFRYGVRLPIGPFFAISSVLVVLLAVVFAGQGVAALQEAGAIPVDPLAVPRMSLLGVFPTVQTVAAQLLVIGVVAVGFLLSFRAQRQTATARAV